VNEACDAAYKKGYKAALKYCNLNCHQCNIDLKTTRADADLQSVGETGRLFIRNLPCSRNSEKPILAAKNQEDDLRAIFEQYGAIAEIRVPVSNRGMPGGYAFVQYVVRENAVTALSELDNTIWHGRRLKVLPYALSNSDNGRKDEANKHGVNGKKNIILDGSASKEVINAEILRLRNEASAEISRLRNLLGGRPSTTSSPQAPPTTSTTSSGSLTTPTTDGQGRPVLTLQKFLSIQKKDLEKKAFHEKTKNPVAPSSVKTASRTTTSTKTSTGRNAMTSRGRNAQPLKTHDQPVYGKWKMVRSSVKGVKDLGAVIMTKRESKNYNDIVTRLKTTELDSPKYRQAALDMLQLGTTIKNKKEYSKRQVLPSKKFQEKLFLPATKDFPDSNWMGIIIGRGGKKIKAVKESSGANVCVCDITTPPHVLIKGETKAQVAKAKQLVQDYIDKEMDRTRKVKLFHDRTRNSDEQEGRKTATEDCGAEIAVDDTCTSADVVATLTSADVVATLAASGV